jgi:hypothetical protein
LRISPNSSNGPLFRRRPGHRDQEGRQYSRPRQPSPRHGRIPGASGLPPAPKLDIFGKLDPAKATEAELRGQDIFFGKGLCGGCHAPPYYTDNTMHNLQMERFYKPTMINGMLAGADGPIKTFPLRGIRTRHRIFMTIAC